MVRLSFPYRPMGKQSAETRIILWWTRECGHEGIPALLIEFEDAAIGERLESDSQTFRLRAMAAVLSIMPHSADNA